VAAAACTRKASEWKRCPRPPARGQLAAIGAGEPDPRCLQTPLGRPDRNPRIPAGPRETGGGLGDGVPEIPYGSRTEAGAGRGCGAGGVDFGGGQGGFGNGGVVGAGLLRATRGGGRGRGRGTGRRRRRRPIADLRGFGRCGWARGVAALGSGAARPRGVNDWVQKWQAQQTNSSPDSGLAAGFRFITLHYTRARSSLVAFRVSQLRRCSRYVSRIALYHCSENAGDGPGWTNTIFL
jgi:hypothetical protein